MTETPTDIGFSYELGVDINLGTPDEPQWQNVRYAKSIAPTAEDKTVDAQTYDDCGADHPVKVGESWRLEMHVQGHRLADGQYLPEIEKLLTACSPDATGEGATVHLRWYDKPAGGKTPNPTDAYQGKGTVSVARAATGTAEEAGWNFTITGQGPRQKIANPLVVKPVITSVEPARATSGKQVTLTGAALSKVTEVKFGSHTADFTKVSDTSIVAVVPSGASGSVQVTAKAASGTSEPKAFTVG